MSGSTPVTCSTLVSDVFDSGPLGERGERDDGPNLCFV
jgi:hypothetical protein